METQSANQSNPNDDGIWMYLVAFLFELVAFTGSFPENNVNSGS